MHKQVKSSIERERNIKHKQTCVMKIDLYVYVCRYILSGVTELCFAVVPSRNLMIKHAWLEIFRFFRLVAVSESKSRRLTCHLSEQSVIKKTSINT